MNKYFILIGLCVMGCSSTNTGTRSTKAGAPDPSTDPEDPISDVDNPTKTNTGKCQLPTTGKYQVEYNTISGNCGDLQSKIADVSTLTDPVCGDVPAIVTTNSSGNCQVSSTGTNCDMGNGITANAKQTFVLSDDYSTGTGSVQITMTDGTKQCSGSYSIHGTRLE